MEVNTQGHADALNSVLYLGNNHIHMSHGKTEQSFTNSGKKTSKSTKKGLSFKN